MDHLVKNCRLKPRQKWEVYTKCLRDWHFAMLTKQESNWLIWSIYHTHGMASSELSEQIHGFCRENSDLLKSSLLLEYLLHPVAKQRKVLERHQFDLPSNNSGLLLLKEFDLPLDLKFLHPELFKSNYFDISEILMIVARKRCTEKATRRLILKILEYMLASYLIYLNLSFFIDLIFWTPSKKITWKTWTYCIPHTFKVIQIHLPSNLLLPLFWIEKWILGHHALQRLTHQLLNIEQLPSQRTLIENGTEEEFLQILEAPNVNALKNKSNSSFSKLLAMELQNFQRT